VLPDSLIKSIRQITHVKEKIIKAGNINHPAHRGVSARFEKFAGRNKKNTVPMTPAIHPPFSQYGIFLKFISFLFFPA